MQTHTREEIENMPAKERPTVRCKYPCRLVNEDGRSTDAIKETRGRIIVDGNNPWLEIWAGGRQHAEQFGWCLVLAVLNDKYEPPIFFNNNHNITYQVR